MLKLQQSHWGKSWFSFFHSSAHQVDALLTQEQAAAHLFPNELLPQELTSLKHVGDVVEWTETFVFVLGLLLNGGWGGGGGGGHGRRKLFTWLSQSCVT